MERLNPDLREILLCTLTFKLYPYAVRYGLDTPCPQCLVELGVEPYVLGAH